MTMVMSDLRPGTRSSEIGEALLPSSEAIVGLDDQYRIVYCNRGAEELLGHTAAAVTGQRFEDLLAEGSRPGFRLALEEVRLMSPRSRRLGEDRTLICWREPGDRFPIAVTVSAPEVHHDVGYALILRPLSRGGPEGAGQALLADLGAALVASLECDYTIQAFMRIIEERFADFCLLVLEPTEGRSARIELGHHDRRREEAVRALLDEDAAAWLKSLVATIRAAEPPVAASRQLDGVAADTGMAQRLIGIVGNDASWMAVPLRAHGRTIGEALFALEDSRAYDRDDVQLAEELGHRLAMALVNDRLYETMTRTLEAHDDVLSFVSHDLRNPLNVITMATQMIQEHLAPGDDFVARWVSAISHSASQMESLVRDLLTAARSAQGRLTLNPRPVAADLVLREAVLAHRESAERKELSLEVRPADPDLNVVLDLDMIMRALSNLIANAVKFTPPGGSVLVGVEDLGDEVRFFVSDTGAGIDEAHLAHVFERFWQAPGSQRDGAGLGLAIVKGAVEAHGGRVAAESRPGRGSTFSFTVPARPQSEGGSVELDL